MGKMLDIADIDKKPPNCHLTLPEFFLRLRKAFEERSEISQKTFH